MPTRFARYFFATLGLVALLALNTGFTFTTANLNNLKVGKDANVTTEASTFAPGDTIYALVNVSNAPSKITVKFQTVYDELTDGKPNYHIDALDKSYTVDKSSVVDYNIIPPPKGWPTGKYHLTATMHVESGEKKDEKTVKFIVKAP